MSVDQLVIMDLTQDSFHTQGCFFFELRIDDLFSRISTIKRNCIEFVEEKEAQKMNGPVRDREAPN